ncbi:PhzF family phenazine biosynthesis protein [Curtobacterium flaccumfaciens]|uniref:PhzF family phenazine biosynthesis protein n=1 Tax=Curtobacterium flaccumfaciens TaxID=2035 RepID=UPI001BDDFE7C|nr:PhzF family phenazine biosynthesis protein [Curtobacterium flaccumfaciens]MBT1608358.1 PhzF family phenazine biosynthesis protein [Curtobacterium flaccumfaciens pv. betae]MBT1656641.1 PhzF family phenazine biosynthesis protein [Curtobacterium flaccumfaciens pv. betae]MCS0470816.1 PhzF family phenazine biosynthesis protein [Curtobacterium flaccumfaciens pv. betae]MCS0473502.1 PhzF family phenazine biosynthesis protein [Curtobacterium flaccumfaciens pv. betae]MCS0477228.1 PhzF family phenazin
MQQEILRYTAFAAEPGGGNPAGLVLDAAGLSDDQMLAIARQVGYPETAFVVGSTATGPRVRYFSPSAEVPFCGHATVALAVALAEREGTGRRVFTTLAGEVALDATVGADGAVQVAMTSVEPATRDLDPALLARLFDLLGLEAADIAPGFPVLESFAGNWHPVLVLHDRELFHQFRFAPGPLAELKREAGWAGTVTVLHRTGDREYEARNLFPAGRITEDPATGSAAASTGAYLRQIGAAQPGDPITIRQGRHVGRPSLLLVDVPEAGGITVTGSATPIS